MFIKFSDKTKKIIVKDSKDIKCNDDNQDEDVLSLDEDSGKNRRIKVLKSYKNDKKNDDKD